jgi:hypothetical protein
MKGRTMTPTLLIVIALLLVLATVMRASRSHAAIAPVSKPAARATTPKPVARATAPTPKALARAPVPNSAPPAEGNPRFEALAWSGSIAAPATSAAASAPASDASCARLRDRYLAARFPGVFRSATDLLETEYVIKVARHCFEEGSVDRADELFALALEVSPAPLTLRLAQIEFAFLARETGSYIRLAKELQQKHPGIAEWPEVARLGAALAPEEEIFGQAGRESNSHYGPWPDMPNWIQASWDLTHEILAADFHRAMSVSLDPGPALAVCRAA